jgi:hypothetical protein
VDAAVCCAVVLPDCLAVLTPFSPLLLCAANPTRPHPSFPFPMVTPLLMMRPLLSMHPYYARFSAQMRTFRSCTSPRSLNGWLQPPWVLDDISNLLPAQFGLFCLLVVSIPVLSSNTDCAAFATMLCMHSALLPPWLCTPDVINSVRGFPAHVDEFSIKCSSSRS